MSEVYQIPFFLLKSRPSRGAYSGVPQIPKAFVGRIEESGNLAFSEP